MAFTKVYRRRCLLCLSLLIIAGCDKPDSFKTGLDNYARALTQVFNVSFDVSSNDRERLAYPRRRDLFVERPENKVSLLEFLRLADCELNLLIGEHNNTLNRFQDEVERLFYDIAFITMAKACVDHVENAEKNVYETLMIAYVQKQKDLDKSFWNALFTSKELVTFFSVYTALPDDDEINLTPAARQAFDFFRSFRSDLVSMESDMKINRTVKRADFDRALGVLADQKYAGKILLAMAATHDILREINAALAHQSSRCRLPGGSDYGEGFGSQLSGLHEEFVTQIEPSVLRILNAAKEVETLSHLFDQSAAHTAEFMTTYWEPLWGRGDESLYTQLSDALTKHRQFWEQTVRLCISNESF